MLNIKIKRPAIAMIELIFAIVIMGIVMMSAPMIISTAAKSGYVTIQQEAINEAASQVNMIMGYHWDEATTDETFLDPILAVSHGDVELNVSAITGRRIGTPLVSSRSSIRSDAIRNIAATTTTDIGSETGETIEDDIDDFEGVTNLVEIEDAGLVDNIEKEANINIATTISYSTDTATYNASSITYNFNPFSTPGGSTNIKSITVTLTSDSGIDELNKTIVLHAFSCNIGGYKLEEKDF